MKTATNSRPRKTQYVSRHFRRSYLKANKVSKVKGQGTFNMHIIFESVLMLFTKNHQN